jgi:hypothetical protein
MLVIGFSTTTIALTTNSPQFVEWFLLIAGVILNIWGVIGVILHLGIKRFSNN